MTPFPRVEQTTARVEGGRTEVRHTVITSRLRLRFRWTGDRWGHAIQLAGPGGWIEAIASWEADADPATPDRVVSPAYQQIHFQESPGGLFVLLVGQSGAHHFSASFSVEEDDARVTVLVDVADRMRRGDPTLACTYHVAVPPSSLVDAGPRAIVWQPPNTHPGQLQIAERGLDGFPTTLATAESGPSRTLVQANAAVIPGAASQRCRYAWIWDGPA